MRPAHGHRLGPEGLKVTVRWLRDAFSDLHYTIEDEIASGDKVVVRVISSGRHTGEFIGFKPTGKKFEAQQIHIYRIADGRIIEHWSSRDDLSQGGRQTLTERREAQRGQKGKQLGSGATSR